MFIIPQIFDSSKPTRDSSILIEIVYYCLAHVQVIRILSSLPHTSQFKPDSMPHDSKQYK